MWYIACSLGHYFESNSTVRSLDGGRDGTIILRGSPLNRWSLPVDLQAV